MDDEQHSMDGTLGRQFLLVEGHIRFPPANLYVQDLDKESSRDEQVSTYRHLPGSAICELNTLPFRVLCS
jgi:hypothetical protein